MSEDIVSKKLSTDVSQWLVTGGAGFIGSHLVEYLLRHNQKVICLDNYSTGTSTNLDLVQKNVDSSQNDNLKIIEGDIRNKDLCFEAIKGCDYVLHQAALGSVPRSIENPLETHDVNQSGFLNILEAAKNESVSSFVYASSSSVYGDSEELPKKEDDLGTLLSPYAVSKRSNELYADAYAERCSFPLIGLRYFNVFGPRQDPEGPYAAVIPRWIDKLSQGAIPSIYGDGETSRDFCFVDNVVQANLLAALSSHDVPSASAFNVAVGEQTTLNELFQMIIEELAPYKDELKDASLTPHYEDFRDGDIRHSLADLSAIREALNFVPVVAVREGIKKTIASQYS